MTRDTIRLSALIFGLGLSLGCDTPIKRQGEQLEALEERVSAMEARLEALEARPKAAPIAAPSPAAKPPRPAAPPPTATPEPPPAIEEKSEAEKREALIKLKRMIRADLNACNHFCDQRFLKMGAVLKAKAPAEAEVYRAIKEDFCSCVTFNDTNKVGFCSRRYYPKTSGFLVREKAMRFKSHKRDFYLQGFGQVECN